MKKKTPSYKSAPPLLSLFFTAASIVFTVILIWGILAYSLILEQKRLYSKIETNLSLNDYVMSETSLNQLLSIFTPDPVEDNPTINAKSWAYITRELHSIVQQLDQGNFTSARNQFELLEQGKLQKLLFAMTPSRNNAALIEEIKSQFNIYGHKLTEVQKLKGRNPARIADYEAEIKQTDFLLKESAAEFSYFCNVDSVVNEKQVPATPIYQAGILKDLPQLIGIRDNLKNLVQFRTELNIAGGYIDLEGNKAPAIFKEKLSSIKKDSKGYTDRIRALQDLINKLSKEQKSKQKELYNLSLEIQEQLKQLLLLVTSPKHNQTTRGLRQFHNLLILQLKKIGL